MLSNEEVVKITDVIMSELEVGCDEAYYAVYGVWSVFSTNPTLTIDEDLLFRLLENLISDLT